MKRITNPALSLRHATSAQLRLRVSADIWDCAHFGAYHIVAWVTDNVFWDPLHGTKEELRSK